MTVAHHNRRESAKSAEGSVYLCSSVPHLWRIKNKECPFPLRNLAHLSGSLRASAALAFHLSSFLAAWASSFATPPPRCRAGLSPSAGGVWAGETSGP